MKSFKISRRSSVAAVALVTCASLACAAESDAGRIAYRGRTIDVRAYVEGFPYKNFYFAPAVGKVFFLRRGDQEVLQEAQFKPGAGIDFAKARPIAQADFTKRNFWGIAASRWNKRTYVRADEDNTEVTNLYELEKTGALKKLTSEGYIYAWKMSPDGRRIAFTARSGKQEFTPGSIGILDLASGKVRKVFEDSKALRMTWGELSWKPDGSAVLASAVCDEDRTHKNLLLVKANGSGSKTLLDCVTKKSVYPTSEWLDNHNAVYRSDESGKPVAFRMDLRTGKRTRLTDPAWILADAELVGGRLVALERRPTSTLLHVIDARDGKILSSRAFAATLFLGRGDRSTAMLYLNAPTVPFEIHSLKVKGNDLQIAKIVDYGAELRNNVVHCDARKVSYRTFDGYAAPGENGTLHAILYTPRHPAPAADARLLVTAFYGGTNGYFAKVHMFCQAGFHVLSPAPRGSWEWGREFHDKMQGDLGGGEILDVMEAARTFSASLGIPPAQVGAFGGSHGGYATMRALTLPETVNGYAPGFRFGFGLSDYGVSNLLRFLQKTNIPGWVTDMTGEDPQKNPEKWLDRSPETGACRASGPLFLSHGTNDKRVGVEESRAMMEALRKCGRTEDAYLELPGQGHGYKGTAAEVTYYRALFGFLDGIAPRQ